MLFPTPNISTSDSNIYIAYLANNIPLKQTKGINLIFFMPILN
jgi:hypothetical protein